MIAPLPPPNTVRWVAHRKAAVVAAVRAGKITYEEACSYYQLSEEFLGWQHAAPCCDFWCGRAAVTTGRKSGSPKTR